MHEEQLRRSWTANAEAWRTAVRNGSIASRKLGTDEAIVQAVLDHSPRRVIDLGCGEGWLVRELHARGIDACGVDASEPLVAAAATQGGGSFYALSYEELLAADPPPPGAFDVAVANFSILEEDLRPVTSAAARALNPNGAFIVQTMHPVVATPDTGYVDGWTTETFAAIKGDWPEPMPWYFRTIGSWVRALRENGFAINEIREPLHPERKTPLSMIFLCRATL